MRNMFKDLAAFFSMLFGILKSMGWKGYLWRLFLTIVIVAAIFGGAYLDVMAFASGNLWVAIPLAAALAFVLFGLPAILISSKKE